MMEILGWSEAHNISVHLKKFGADFAVAQGLNDSEALLASQELGGTIKVAEVCDEFLLEQNFNWTTYLTSLITKQNFNEKINFGLSWYGSTKLKSAQLSRYGLSVKRELKALGEKVRFVQAEDLTLSSVQVDKNKLVAGGIEVIIINDKDSVIIGKTIAVQPFENWSRRDYGRPKRDAKSGMLPPKLARMMINMLGVAPKGALLDPFCGSGTVATEAAALGWKGIMCSDISAKAVNDTKQNLKWVSDEFNYSVNLQTKALPIEQLSSFIKSDSLAAIVTEGYLGPALTKPAQVKDIEKIKLDLIPIYKKLLHEIVRTLKNNGRAVVAMPRWIDKAGNEISLLKMRQVLPPGLRVKPNHKFTDELPIYRRSDQFVFREIVILERKPRVK